MPTGYTAAIVDGISFEQYAWSCARAFGALVMMRDEPNAPIPQEFKPSDYYARSVNEAKERLSKLRVMTPEHAHAECQAEYTAALKSWGERRAARANLLTKYETMLLKVEAWTPPTAEHQGLKDFMESQIRESINWDCSDKYDIAPKCTSASAWLATSIGMAESQLIRDLESQAAEIERTNGRNSWLLALRNSVPQPSA